MPILLPVSYFRKRSNERLLEIFGEEIAGVPTETVLSITRTQVWGGN